MNDTKIIETLEQTRARWDVAADKVDAVASAATDVFKQDGSFKQALALARAVRDMRDLLTDEMMMPVMELMNTNLGFRTDKDPNVPHWETGKCPVAYPVSVVREVFIEAKLRGFHPVGNEFNIISSQFYGTQNGFNRKVRELTKGSYEDSIDVPDINQAAKQATITCRATWRINGVEGSIGVKKDDPCRFMVRINNFMLPDAIAGKAKRKLLKRVFERLTGQVVSDDEASDIVIDLKTAPAKEQPTAQLKEPEPGNTVDSKTVIIPASEGPQATQLQAQFAEFCAGLGITFDNWREFATQKKLHADPSTVDCMLNIPDSSIRKLQENAKDLALFTKTYKRK